MTAFALYDNGGAAKRKEFTLNSKYQKSTHQYECVVPDMNTAVYAQATGETGYQINARYQKQTTISQPMTYFYETQIRNLILNWHLHDPRLTGCKIRIWTEPEPASFQNFRYRCIRYAVSGL